MQKFETLDEARRHIADKLGAKKVGKEAGLPYQTVSRFIRQYSPPMRRSTQHLIARGAHNAAVNRIAELTKELKELNEYVVHCKSWVYDTQ